MVLVVVVLSTMEGSLRLGQKILHLVCTWLKPRLQAGVEEGGWIIEKVSESDTRGD